MNARRRTQSTAQSDSQLVKKRKQSAVAAYAARVAKKKVADADADNHPYEFAQNKRDVKRLRQGVQLQLSREEAQEYGSDSADDDDGDNQDVRTARLLDEGDVLASEDDEELDSDDAWNSSDEEDYAGYGLRKKQSDSSSRPANVDLNENSDASEVNEFDDADDYLDALQVFDGVQDSSDVAPPSDPKSVKRKTTEQAIVPAESHFNSDEELEDDDDSIASDDEGAALELGESKLEDFLASLPLKDASSLKRKDNFSTTDGPVRQRRRVLKDQTMVGEENEFAAFSSNDVKITLNDLLAPLKDSALAKDLKPLLASRAPKALDAPLELRHQAKLDREAAYDLTKEEVSKWDSLQKKIRDAEHLSFPLQQPTTERTTNMTLVSRFKPKSELESSVARLLASAEVQSTQEIDQNETLAMNHLSAEEVQQRRKKLAKMREIMWRNEVKARRVGKIKSKLYRKIHRKAKEKLKADLNTDGDEEDEADLVDAREREHALQRATLKYKRSGNPRNPPENEEVHEDAVSTIDRAELLRQKIRGDLINASDDEDFLDEDEDTARAKALEELRRIDSEETEPEDTTKSGIFGMKFMQDAEKRRKAEFDRLAKDMVSELDPESAFAENNAGLELLQGRMTFQPSEHVSATSLNRPPSDASSVTLQSADLLQSPTSPIHQPLIQPTDYSAKSTVDGGNPWLVTSRQSGIAKKKNELVVGKDVDRNSKAAYTLSKKGQREKVVPTEDDGHLDISLENTLGPRSNNLSVTGKGPIRATAFEQRELVAQAFAGDNVVEAFEEAKQREIQADAPKTVDVTIHGWGSWGGSGVNQKTGKKFTKHVPGIEASKRTDANKSHVIISERRDKKAAKYLVKDLPFPYTSKKQYEQSLNSPVGPEWNTRAGFQRGTLPRVTKKMGQLIEPLQKDS